MTNIINDYNYNQTYYYCYNGKCCHFTKLMWLIINEHKIKNGHRKIMRHLKKRNNLEKINYVNDDGWTALMIASIMSNKWSSYSTVKLLIKLGANVNIKNQYGCTALMLAVRNSNTTSSLRTVKLLLDNHADMELKSLNAEYTALMYACWYSGTDSTIETVKLLLDRGASINAQSSEGYSSLMIALRNNKTNKLIEIVKLLLNQGAFVDLTNNNKDTALLIAVCRCNMKYSVKIVELLLKHGANINHCDNSGLSILNLACIFAGRHNKFEIVYLLLKYGANVKSVTNMGLTVLMVLCFNILDIDNGNIVEYLLDYDHDCDINAVSRDGYTALMYVLLFTTIKLKTKILTRLKYAEILLRRGANPNILFKNNTILRSISRNTDNYEIIRLLLQYNLNTNIIVDNMNDLLWIAKNIKSENKLQLLSLLLEYGADDKITDEEGHTFIDFLDNDEILHCTKIIDDIKLKKDSMDIVIESIPEIVPQYIYDVNSFSVQLLNLKWNINEYNSKQDLPESYLKYYDYFNAIDIEDFKDKINDAIKYIY
ncbi:ankyrin repeat protein [Cotonvirus japonicus]|uniref:Ankyrin repeat protein n=1 Tax=Cotonvirus japonicus TaxID=2811091 RepID=A0ABM7NRC1_9VIRU|nr:ankyrin repeat protein [Cotonvirus japonicus]BCS82646.1 ankyrin repeat protein [Cotonvirus japonicus]